MNFFNRNGLSYVEVIVSTLVIGVIAAAFYGINIVSRDTLSLAHHKVLALYWAQAQIEAAGAGVVIQDDPFLSYFLEDVKGGAVTESPWISHVLRIVNVSVSWTE